MSDTALLSQRATCDKPGVTAIFKEWDGKHGRGQQASTTSLRGAQADEQLFRDEADDLRFETELRTVVTDSAIQCLAACVMTTH